MEPSVASMWAAQLPPVFPPLLAGSLLLVHRRQHVFPCHMQKRSLLVAQIHVLWSQEPVVVSHVVLFDGADTPQCPATGAGRAPAAQRMHTCWNIRGTGLNNMKKLSISFYLTERLKEVYF